METDLTTPPSPNRPSEQQVRDNFGRYLPEDARLMRPPYTTLWALEDGTLLWSEKEGYADLAPKLKNIIYLTGPQGSGKSRLARLFHNSVEVEVQTVNILNHVTQKYSHLDTIVLTSQKYNMFKDQNIEKFCADKGLHYENIQLTLKNSQYGN